MRFAAAQGMTLLLRLRLLSLVLVHDIVLA